MADSPFVMRFDPKTINHLGLRMYATLPPAIAEIVANAYDAYAANVAVLLKEEHGKPISITVTDDGIGLSKEEINSKFLVIGRNRREDKEVVVPPGAEARYKRLPIGKKGLRFRVLFRVYCR